MMRINNVWSLICLSLSYPSLANCLPGDVNSVRSKEWVATYQVTTQVMGKIQEEKTIENNRVLDRKQLTLPTNANEEECIYDTQSQTLLLNYMFDQYRLTGSQHQILKQYVELVGDDVDILVEGHADSTGSERYNKWLSERRAREVSLYLKDALKLGNRIKLVAFGEASPACSIPENKRNGCNRRVVLSLKSQG